MDFWHLSHSEWFDVLNEEAKKVLNQNSEEIAVEKGQSLFNPEPRPNYVYILLDGLVSVYRMNADGDRLIMAFVRPGQVFGELSVVSQTPRETHAQSTRNSRVLKVATTAFMNILTISNPASLYITKTVANDLIKFQRRFEDLVFRSVRARLASVLCELAEDFGQTRENGIYLDVRLSQTEFAQLIGASRPSVNIAFREFQTDGEVRFDRNGMSLLDIETLKKIAHSDLPRAKKRMLSGGNQIILDRSAK